MIKKILVSVIAALMVCSMSNAQEQWELKKNKNSVQVWTKNAPGWDLRQYRAICQINASAEDVYNFIMQFDKRTEWYSDNSECKVLHKDGNEEFVVYEVYAAPWPVDDRDVISKVLSSKEANGNYLIRSSALPNYAPRKKDLVRIEKALGTWKIEQLDQNVTQVTMEAKANTGGEVPEWLANMFIEESPFKSLTNLKAHFEVQ